MVPADLMEWGKGIAVFGGVIAGLGVVAVTSVVWLQKQILGFGGATLCTLGTIMIVSSIFHNVTFAAGGANGINLKLAELENQIRETKAAVQSTNEQFAALRASRQPEVASFRSAIEQINAKLSQVSSNSNAALAGVQEMKMKVLSPPAFDRDQPKTQQAPFREEKAPSPNFAPMKE